MESRFCLFCLFFGSCAWWHREEIAREKSKKKRKRHISANLPSERARERCGRDEGCANRDADVWVSTEGWEARQRRAARKATMGCGQPCKDLLFGSALSFSVCFGTRLASIERGFEVLRLVFFIFKWLGLSS